jgi:SAM-dependent methyltransferase
MSFEAVATDLPSDLVYEADGFCPICEAAASFRSRKTWLRGRLKCSGCRSVPRERALALVLSEVAPRWRMLRIHESSPVKRGISRKLAKECPNYVASQFYPGRALGERVGKFVNEDLENQTFPDDSFDMVVSLDVMEHIFEPWSAYREIYRTLRPGGIYLHTYPIKKDQVVPIIARSVREEDGSIRHILAPEYHGNPVSDEGSLVTNDYGYYISVKIAEWAPFDVRVYRFCDALHGILGEFTEVVCCFKRQKAGLPA